MADTTMASTKSLYSTESCGCTLHAPVDNQGACHHCDADEDMACGPSCPVDELCERGYYGPLSGKQPGMNTSEVDHA